jgi:hypothetical protein
MVRPDRGVFLSRDILSRDKKTLDKSKCIVSVKSVQTGAATIFCRR